SKITKNNCMDSQLYSFISDFRNFEAMVPSEHRNKANFSQHSVTIEVMQGMNITLQIIEEEPYKLIKLGSEQNKEFCIWIQLKQVAPYDTRIRITLHADIPLMAKMFAKNKLQVFVDGFAEALAQIPVYAFQGNNLN
ncbi:MAG TPA: hypothetical protein P5243_09665, partial [Bacteroidales bacterium]|nr:hypothetical protein [Bacteroidales bacterium]